VKHIVPLLPQGTNSTMFTACCEVAICSDQARCPQCKELVVGHDAAPGHERDLVRWRDATATWDRDKIRKEGGYRG